MKTEKVIKINEEYLKDFLDYLLEKVEDCYKKECKVMIERFLEKVDD